MADSHAQATRNAALVNLHSAAGVGHAMGNISARSTTCAVAVWAAALHPVGPTLVQIEVA